jgi:seryl-tRNA(Sec) selenium transferase
VVNNGAAALALGHLRLATRRTVVVACGELVDFVVEAVRRAVKEG